MSGPPIQSINIFSLRFGLWVRNSYYLLLYLDTSLKLNIPFFSGVMPVCILEQSTAARRNVVTAITLDQRRSLRANSLALLCQLLNFDFICAVEVFLAINNLQTIVIVLFNQIPKLYSQRNLQEPNHYCLRNPGFPTLECITTLLPRSQHSLLYILIF